MHQGHFFLSLFVPAHPMPSLRLQVVFGAYRVLLSAVLVRGGKYYTHTTTATSASPSPQTDTVRS